jgi:organic hydroperoxide reductase OsmC/OhrA/RimJ/RimL family protein N-acetyltransferase
MKTKLTSTSAKQMQKTHRYRVAAWWTAGRAGIAKAASAPKVIHFAAPPEFRGLEAMWTPEDLLLSAVASCFTATFHVIAVNAKFEYTDLEVGAEGVVSRGDLGYTFSEIVVHPTLTIAREQDREQALDLLQKAKTLCLVSRALTTPQKFEMLVNISEISSEHEPSTEPNQSSKLAIHPHPSQYAWQCTMKDHTNVELRPICPEDESMMVKFHETLSDRTVYFRYFHSVSLQSRVAHERLARICFVDHDREIVLVADYEDPKTGRRQILGVGRLNKLQGRNEGEVAVLVSDHYQRQGVGAGLLRRLIQIATDEKLSRVSGEMLRENLAMQVLIKKIGFSLRLLEDPAYIRAFLDL